MGTGQLEILAPMLVAIVFTLTVGGVILLRPLFKRLGVLLEVMARERRQPQLGNEVEHIRELLETMNGRLSLLEERQDFTDALMSDPDRMRLRSADPGSDHPGRTGTGGRGTQASSPNHEPTTSTPQGA